MSSIMNRLPLKYLMVFAIAVCGCHVSAFTPPVNGSLVGKTEAAVRSQLGRPHVEFTGHYGAPALAFTQSFVGEIKTSVFANADGDIYVSFEKRHGTWVAICNDWLQKGAEF